MRPPELRPALNLGFSRQQLESSFQKDNVDLLQPAPIRHQQGGS